MCYSSYDDDGQEGEREIVQQGTGKMRGKQEKRERDKEKILSRIKHKMPALVELTRQWERQLINTSK